MTFRFPNRSDHLFEALRRAQDPQDPEDGSLFTQIMEENHRAAEDAIVSGSVVGLAGSQTFSLAKNVEGTENWTLPGYGTQAFQVSFTIGGTLDAGDTLLFRVGPGAVFSKASISGTDPTGLSVTGTLYGGTTNALKVAWTGPTGTGSKSISLEFSAIKVT